MPTGIIYDWRRRAAKKHAEHKVTCVCGKIMHGNGASNHLKVCEAYIAYRYQRGRPKEL